MYFGEFWEMDTKQHHNEDVNRLCGNISRTAAGAPPHSPSPPADTDPTPPPGPGPCVRNPEGSLHPSEGKIGRYSPEDPPPRIGTAGKQKRASSQRLPWEKKTRHCSGGRQGAGLCLAPLQALAGRGTGVGAREKEGCGWDAHHSARLWLSALASQHWCTKDILITDAPQSTRDTWAAEAVLSHKRVQRELVSEVRRPLLNESVC